MQRTFRGISAALAGLGLAVLVGCTPTAAPSPIPTPSVPTCVPLDGASPFPCTQADFDALAEQRALYEEAEAVLGRYYSEVNRQEVDWRLREMTPEFEATTEGEFREFTQRIIDLDRRDEARRVGDPAPVMWVRPQLEGASDGFVAVLRSCVDGTQTRYVTKASPEPRPGVTYEFTYSFNRVNDALKIATSTFEGVKGC